MSEVDWIGTYRASRYAFLMAGRWREFALDGADPPDCDLARSVTLITAWNPSSEERPRGWNDAANARLLRALVGRAQPWGPARGGSLPGVEPAWREEGFAVFGLDPAAACAWGRDWAQRAVVWLEAGRALLLFCQEEEAVTCRVRRFDSTGFPQGWPSEPQGGEVSGRSSCARRPNP